MDQIQNIDGLIKRLNLCNATTGYLDVMREINIPQTEFERYFSWNDQHYTRNQVARSDDYELILTCWENGQSGYIHDYDAHEAWIHPIQGKLREDRFVMDHAGQLQQVSSVLLGTQEFSYMRKGIDIHRYSNANQGRSVSLHLYARPVDSWTIYTLQDGNTGKKQVHPDHVATSAAVYT